MSPHIIFFLAMVISIQCQTESIDPSPSISSTDIYPQSSDQSIATSVNQISSEMESATVTENLEQTLSPSSPLLDIATLISGSTEINSNSIMATSNVSDTTSLNIEALLMETSITLENLLQQPVMIKTSFALANNWNATLNNPASNDYIVLRTKVIDEFNKLFASDPDYINTTLTSFASGSIIVNVIINFNPQTTVASVTAKRAVIVQDFADNNFANFVVVANSMNITIVTNGQWSAWSDVTGICVSKLKSQTRVCTPPTGGGSPCAGANSQTIACTSSSSVTSTSASYSLLSLVIVTITMILS